MPRPFNTNLRGFLGLLDAKVQGRAPENFLENVQPTLDAFDFLYAARRRVLQIDCGLSSTAGEGFWPGLGGLSQVPQDELWYVDRITTFINSPLLAAEELLYYPAVNYRTTLAFTGHTVLAQPRDRVSVAGDVPRNPSDRPYLGLPGDVFGVWIEHIVTAATINILIELQLLQLKI